MLGDSIRLSQELGYRRGEAMAVVYLGRSLVASGRPAEAGPHVDRALKLLDGLDDPAAVAIALLYAGLARISPASLRKPAPGMNGLSICAGQ